MRYYHRGTLLHNHYDDSTLNYTTTYHVRFIDRMTNNVITTETANQHWDYDNTPSDLGLSIPNGYSDQEYDLQLLYANANHQTLPNIPLGLSNARVKNNEFWIDYYVTPAAGEIRVIVLDINLNPIAIWTTYGKAGSSFNLNKLLSEFPNKDYTDILYPKDGVAQYSHNTQTLIIQDIPPQPNNNGGVWIQYMDKDQNYIDDGFMAYGTINTKFDSEAFKHEVSKHYDFIRIYNPDDVTMFGSLYHAPTVYFVVSIHETPAQIKIQYRDVQNHLVNDTFIDGYVGQPFNLYKALHIPKGYIFLDMDTASSVTQFTKKRQVVTVFVQATDINHHYEPPVPGKAYVMYVDEQKDVSSNPSTYNATDTTTEQKSPNPVTNIITMNENPIHLPDLNNVSPKDIYYNGQQLDTDPLVTGPDNYWNVFYNSEEFPQMYEYQVDTSDDLYTQKYHGNPVVVVPCYPAYITGITFQFGTLDRFGNLKDDVIDLPSNASVRQYYPSGWSMNTDDLTGQLTYTVPYGTSITTYDLAHIIFGGAKGQFQDSKGNAWQVAHNRKITFIAPYSYKVKINKIS